MGVIKRRTEDWGLCIIVRATNSQKSSYTVWFPLPETVYCYTAEKDQWYAITTLRPLVNFIY